MYQSQQFYILHVLVSTLMQEKKSTSCLHIIQCFNISVHQKACIIGVKDWRIRGSKRHELTTVILRENQQHQFKRYFCFHASGPQITQCRWNNGSQSTDTLTIMGYCWTGKVIICFIILCPKIKICFISKFNVLHTMSTGTTCVRKATLYTSLF